MTHDAEIFGHGIEISDMADRLRELAYGLADIGDQPSDIADAIAMAVDWPRELISIDVEICRESGIGLIAVHIYGRLPTEMAN